MPSITVQRKTNVNSETKVQLNKGDLITINGFAFIVTGNNCTTEVSITALGTGENLALITSCSVEYAELYNLISEVYNLGICSYKDLFIYNKEDYEIHVLV